MSLCVCVCVWTLGSRISLSKILTIKVIALLPWAAAAAAKPLQSYPTLCDPIDSSPPGPPVRGILQARTLEWVAISFSSACKCKVQVKSLSRVWLLQPYGLQPTRLLLSWDFPGKSTGRGCHCLLCFSLEAPTSKITHIISLISFWFLSQCKSLWFPARSKVFSNF